MGLIGACTSKEPEDTGIELPPEETGDTDTVIGETGFPLDTSELVIGNEDPDHWLYLYQDGEWNLSPSGGPYTAMVGSMIVQEFLDYERPPEDTGDTGVPWDTGEDNPLMCDLAYSLIGAPAEDSCTGCTVTMEVEFNLVSGNIGDCRDSNLPMDGEVLTFGYSPGDGTLVLDYADANLWFPWYLADVSGDTLTFGWEERYAISIEEEEEDQ